MKVSKLIISLIFFAFPSSGTSANFDMKRLNEAIENNTFKNITSVLVASKGDLALEAYWNGANKNTLHDTRSATKSITAMAVGAAIDDGFISGVEESAFASLNPKTKVPGKLAVTIKDLLTMTSSLDCNDNDSNSPGNEANMYPQRKWLDFVTGLPIKDAYKKNANGLGAFSYCTAGSFLLGQIVQSAAKQPIDKYIEKRLFAPLGITNVHWDRSPSSEVQTGGGTELSSRDLLKLGELVRNGGVYKGQKILRKNWIDEMLTKHTAANDKQYYGYQWWHRDFKCGATSVSGWYMAGNGGNKLVVFKQLELTVLVTATHYGQRNMHQQTTKLIETFILNNISACNA